MASSTKAVIEEYADRFARLLKRLCNCYEALRRNRWLIELLRLEGSVRRCIESRLPCDLGMVRVSFTGGLLKKRVMVIAGDRVMNIDEFNSLLSTARSFLQWYEDDCSSDILYLDLAGVDHAEEIIRFIKANKETLANVCEGKPVELTIKGVPDYVNEGLMRALMKSR